MKDINPITLKQQELILDKLAYYKRENDAGCSMNGRGIYPSAQDEKVKAGWVYGAFINMLDHNPEMYYFANLESIKVKPGDNSLGIWHLGKFIAACPKLKMIDLTDCSKEPLTFYKDIVDKLPQLKIIDLL